MTAATATMTATAAPTTATATAAMTAAPGGTLTRASAAS